jgi:uncharacterized Zn finger protein
MCKHVAATLYGVGARLDTDPELLFALRDVDHLELIGQAVDSESLSEAFHGKSDNPLTDSNLDIDDVGPAKARKSRKKPARHNPKSPKSSERSSEKKPRKAMAAARNASEPLAHFS